MDEFIDAPEPAIPTTAELKDDSQVVIVTPDADKLNANAQARMKKLLEQKSISVQRVGKAPIKIGPKTLNEVDLPDILKADDTAFYDAKKEEYLNKYPDLADDPFDMDDLHHAIMEQIIQRNLFKKKKKYPSSNITEEYQASVKREGEFKKNLSVRRSDRVKQKDNKKPQVNIAKLSVHFGENSQMAALENRLQGLAEEEQILRIGDKVIE